MLLGKLDSYTKINEIKTLPHTIYKNKLKWYKELNIRHNTVQLKVKAAQFGPTLCNPLDLHSPWNFLGQNSGVGSLSLFQGVFPTTQGSNPGLLHCRQTLYQLSHKGSPRILEWVAYPFSSG